MAILQYHSNKHQSWSKFKLYSDSSSVAGGWAEHGITSILSWFPDRSCALSHVTDGNDVSCLQYLSQAVRKFFQLFFPPPPRTPGCYCLRKLVS